MKERFENQIKKLWYTYFVYGKISVNKKNKPDFDPKEYANTCTDSFLEYALECGKTYPHWIEGIETLIENEIRILIGFIECYDRPLPKKKWQGEKTRWCL